VAALLVHIYLMANGLINHDSAVVTGNNQWFNIFSGRWFAMVPDMISGTFNLMWVNSLFSIIYLSVAACLIGACLEIRRTPLVLVLSALIVSFPAVASGLSDRFEADKFFFAVLLACSAVYLTRQFRFGVLAGIFLLLFSLATYQAYVGFFSGLAVLILIRELMTGREFRRVMVSAVKYVVVLVVALGAYVVSVKLTNSTGGSGYKDINTFGGFSLQNLPARFIFAYRNFFEIFFKNSQWIHQDFLQNGQRYEYVFALTAFVMLGLLIIIVSRNSMTKDPARLVAVVLLAALIPPAINIIAMVTPDSLYILMQYSLVLYFAFALVLVDVAVGSVAASSTAIIARLAHMFSWLIILFCCLVAFSYALYTNVFYSKMDLMNKQGQAYSTILVTRIQSQSYYTPDIPIVLYGAAPQSFALGYYANFYAIPLEDMPNMYSYPAYLLTYMDLHNPISRNDGSMPAALSSDANAMAAISKMPIYPETGSIDQFDGYIVVKFSN